MARKSPCRRPLQVPEVGVYERDWRPLLKMEEKLPWGQVVRLVMGPDFAKFDGLVAGKDYGLVDITAEGRGLDTISNAGKLIFKAMKQGLEIDDYVDETLELMFLDLYREQIEEKFGFWAIAEYHSWFLNIARHGGAVTHTEDYSL